MQRITSLRAINSGTQQHHTETKEAKQIPAPKNWEYVVAGLREHAPYTNEGWPKVITHYQNEFGKVQQHLQGIRDDDEYKKLVVKNGKVLVGDAHNLPEGWVALHALLKKLPVKKLYLESDGMGLVLQNEVCMQWIRENRHANTQETFAKMTELCLSQPTSQGCNFMNMVNKWRDRQGMPFEEAIDIYRRWIEIECNIARHVIEHDISVQNMFDDIDKNSYNG